MYVYGQLSAIKDLLYYYYYNKWYFPSKCFIGYKLRFHSITEQSRLQFTPYLGDT